MLSRVAYLENIVESQKIQIRKQAERINEIWNLLQGPGAVSCVVPPEVIVGDSVTPPVSVIPTLPSRTDFNVVPGIKTTTKSAEEVSDDSPPSTQRQAYKRKEHTSSPVKEKDYIRNKRRKSIRATTKFIKTLDLTPLSQCKKDRDRKKSTSKRDSGCVTPAQVVQDSHDGKVLSPKLTPVERFHAIVQVISPASRTVCNKLAQCHTYTAVGKVISVEGGSAATIDKRFGVVCAFCDKMTKQGSSNSNSKWYTGFLDSGGAIELFVQWLQDLSIYINKVLDEKVTIMTQYLNGFNANASEVINRFQVCGTTSQYIEVLLLILEEANWTARKVHDTRIDKILKELYKSLTKHNKAMMDKLEQPHKLSTANIESIKLYAFHLLSTANKLKSPWENFRLILQTIKEDEEE